jgi:hypothetical protein
MAPGLMARRRIAPGLMTFRRTLVGTIVVLAILVTGFAALDRAQGPKLASAQVDTVAVVSQPAQTLRLFLNERIAVVRAKQVRMSPAAPITVSTTGQLVAVQFTQPLHYATTYRVTLAGVTSSDDAQSTTLAYTFRTESPSVYYLRRGAGTDQILKTGIRGAAGTVVYSAPRIQDFAVFPHALAVVTLDANGNSSLAFVTGTGIVSPVTLPGPGTIDLVRASQDLGLLGFTFTDAGATTRRKYSGTLFTVDPDGTAIPKPVRGLDGKPLSVLQWFFVPASDDVVAQAADGSVLEVDPATPKAATPLGSYLELDAVSTDGRSIVVCDETGAVAIALSTGRHERLTASRLDGVAASGGAAQVVPGGWLQVDSTWDAKIGGFVQHLAFDNGTAARDLFHTANPLGSIGIFSDSPNNQYVAIETIPDVATTTSDDYLVNGRSTSVTTQFVDISTGLLVKSVSGFDVQWGS